MKPTTTSLAMLMLGLRFQMYRWDAFRENYDEALPEMRSTLAELGAEVALPDSVEEYRERYDELVLAVSKHLGRERSQLGGDVYGLTMFWLGYVPFELVLSATWQSENYEPLLRLLGGVLADLGIESEYDSIRATIDLETRWLAEQSRANGGDLSVHDATKAMDRLLGRITHLWGIVEKHDISVNFANAPFFSVFISYSSSDEEFATKLYEALGSAGVRVWYAPHNMKPGRKVHKQIRGAIERHDRLLLVLSEASLASDWVATELFRVRERERREKVQVLFPVRLVPFERLRHWELLDGDSGRDLAREVREYFIPDFSGWRDEERFDEQVRRLVEALVKSEEDAAVE